MIGKQLGPLKRETAVTWLADVTPVTSLQYMATDMVDLLQECIENKDFVALPIRIRNRSINDTEDIRDVVLDLYFLGKPTVILFHEEWQLSTERLEAYTERENFCI